MMTVSELATSRPLSVRVLQRHGIDFCCGGARPLDAACTARGLRAETLLQEVDAVEAEARPDARRWDQAPIPELVAHILARHHRPLDTELDRLDFLVGKVTTVHHDKDPAMMDGIRQAWQDLLDDLLPHMKMEEDLLFPRILAGVRAGPDPGLGSPIEVMEEEHKAVGRTLATLRALTKDYVVPDEACGSWRALWQGLEALEADLHQHIHLENNVLFQRVLRS